MVDILASTVCEGWSLDHRKPGMVVLIHNHSTSTVSKEGEIGSSPGAQGSRWPGVPSCEQALTQAKWKERTSIQGSQSSAGIISSVLCRSFTCQ